MHLTNMDIERRMEHHEEAAENLLSNHPGLTGLTRAQAHATMATYYLQLLSYRKLR